MAQMFLALKIQVVVSQHPSVHNASLMNHVLKTTKHRNTKHRSLGASIDLVHNNCVGPSVPVST